MNFLSMKYFCAVAKERSITKAAQGLHITQQTLSAHIASLEKEVGAPLFLRRAPLELTYAGTVFLAYARQFERLHLSMEQEFADIRAEQSGVLRVGIAYTRGRTLMPSLITRYQTVYPKMQVQMVEALNDVLCQKLIDRELDLAIASFPPNLPEIETADFYGEEVVLVVANSLLNQLYGDKAPQIIEEVRQSRSISALAGCPFLLSSREDIAGRIGGSLINEAAFLPKISAQSGNIGTLLDLCAQGVGACFCPEILLPGTLPDGGLETMQVFRFGEAARYQIHLGWSRQPYVWKAISAFVETALASDAPLFQL